MIAYGTGMASMATDLKSDCASYFMEATGGDMMNAAKRSRSLKRKIHPIELPIEKKRAKSGHSKVHNERDLMRYNSDKDHQIDHYNFLNIGDALEIRSADSRGPKSGTHENP